MNFEQLERAIIALSDSETAYLSKTKAPLYSDVPTIRISNQDVFQFNKQTFISQNAVTKFHIRKQSRFVPVPPHVTDIIELNYVYKGNCTQYVNQQSIQLQQGDLIIIDTEATHSSEAIGINDIVIGINIDQEFFKSNFLNQMKEKNTLSQFLFQAISKSHHHNQYLLFRGKEENKLHLLFQQLMHEVYFPSLLQSHVQTHLLQLIMLELICSFSVEANGITENNDKQQLIYDILTYIDHHFATTHLEDCAQHFGYHSSYFSTLIKAHVNKNFKDILQEKRIEASIPLLLHSHLPIQEISHDVGFSSLNQYYKAFEKYHHTTPGAFRKKDRIH